MAYEAQQGIPKFGIGDNCFIKNAIVDKNCRIGNNVRINGGTHLADTDHHLYVVKDGIVVVKKGAVVPDGFYTWITNTTSCCFNNYCSFIMCNYYTITFLLNDCYVIISFCISSPRQNPGLHFGQLFNMSFGFFGIQFGFALQNANVSRIFQTLGADIDKIAILMDRCTFYGLISSTNYWLFKRQNMASKFGAEEVLSFLLERFLHQLHYFLCPILPCLWMAATFTLDNGCIYQYFNGTIPCICWR